MDVGLAFNKLESQRKEMASKAHVLMNVSFEQWRARIVVISCVCILQYHSIKFWEYYTGEGIGLFTSVVVEGVTLWLWYQEGSLKRIMGILGSFALLAGILFQLATDVINHQSATAHAASIVDQAQSARNSDRDARVESFDFLISMYQGELENSREIAADYVAIMRDQERKGFLKDVSAYKEENKAWMLKIEQETAKKADYIAKTSLLYTNVSRNDMISGELLNMGYEGSKIAYVDTTQSKEAIWFIVCLHALVLIVLQTANILGIRVLAARKNDIPFIESSSPFSDIPEKKPLLNAKVQETPQTEDLHEEGVSQDVVATEPEEAMVEQSARTPHDRLLDLKAKLSSFMEKEMLGASALAATVFSLYPEVKEKTLMRNIMFLQAYAHETSRKPSKASADILDEFLSRHISA